MKVFPLMERDGPILWEIRRAMSPRDHGERLRALDGLSERLALAQLEGFQRHPLLSKSARMVRETAMRRALTEPKRAVVLSAWTRADSDFSADVDRVMKTAELTAIALWEALANGERPGVQSLRPQVVGLCRRVGIHRSLTNDTMDRHWKAYRGVAHLGAGLIWARMEELDDDWAGVRTGEEIRHVLSTHCPKNTRAPYVQAGDQIAFMPQFPDALPRLTSKR